MKLKENSEIVVMKSTIWLLRLSFLFPSIEELKDPRKNVYFKYIMMNVIGSYFPIGIILHLINNIKTGANNYLDEDIMMVLSYSGLLYFTFQYVIKIKTVVKLCRKLSDFETFGKPKDFDKMNKFFNNFSVFYFLYHLTMCTLVSFSNAILISRCREENAKRSIQEVCGMIGSMWLPFDYDFFPLKQILFAYQYFATMLLYQNGGLITFVIMESTQHVNIRFQHLLETFIDALNLKDPTERREHFNKAVQYHYALIELGSMINTCYNQCCLVHLILTAPVLGSCVYRVTTSAPIDAICLLVCWLVSTCIACSTGQQLRNSSELISDILYQTEWIKLETELKKDIMLVMLRARRPSLLTAGPLRDISYQTIVLIAKTSYSYMALMQQTL